MHIYFWSGNPSPYVKKKNLQFIIYKNDHFELNNIDQAVVDPEGAAGAAFCKLSISKDPFNFE